MEYFAETNQVFPAYSMLRHIGRVATLKLVSRNCLRCLQTTLIIGTGGLAAEFMSGIIRKVTKKKVVCKNPTFFLS